MHCAEPRRRIRMGKCMGKAKNNNRIAVILSATLLPAVFLLSFFVGKYNIDWSQIFTEGTMDNRVFVYLRTGRSLMVMFAGIGLGMAGYTFQNVFRNPLASPDVAGVASGAGVGAAAAMTCGAGIASAIPGIAGFGVISLAALLGGMAALSLVLLLTRLSGRSGTVTLLLSGIIVNAVFQALLMIIKMYADSEKTLESIEFWLMGSFSDVTLTAFLKIIIWLGLGIGGMLLMSRRIILLSLPDDEAQMLGINVKRTRILALAAATLATASVICVTGIVAFIGLLAPHIARRIDIRGGIVLSGATGAFLLLVSDILVRIIGSSELPISVVTSLTGAPLLFFLVLRERGKLKH